MLVAGGPVVHLVVVYGFQGASKDPQKLRPTEKLLDAVLCELAVVASGHPCLVVGDLNIEPEKIPCLLKGFHGWSLVRSAVFLGCSFWECSCLYLSFFFGLCGGSRRDFVLGYPFAASSLRWCKVLEYRWVPHCAVRASFSMGRWSARVCFPVGFSVLWPAAWVSCLDRSGSSKSAEVRRFWEENDESLQLVHPDFWEGVRSALLAGDVSSAWSVWSSPAGGTLVRAFLAAGAALPASGVRLGRGSAQFGHVAAGVPVVGKLRSGLGSGDGQSVDLFKDASVSRAILLRRRLGCVLSVLDGISRHGLTISRCLELGAQWDAVVWSPS